MSNLTPDTDRVRISATEPGAQITPEEWARWIDLLIGQTQERERLRLVNLVHDEDWGLPFDSDHDRAIVAAWIEEATP